MNLEALSKWTGHIPGDVVRDMAQIAPMLARLGYDPYANPPNYGNPDPIVINNTHRVSGRALTHVEACSHMWRRALTHVEACSHAHRKACSWSAVRVQAQLSEKTISVLILECAGWVT